MARILVIGGSGLVGGHLLDRLAGSPQHRVHALLRRPVAERTALVQIVMPTAGWAEAARALAPDILVSALGTTIAQAGSQDAFRAIDHDLPLAIAGAVRSSGARHCLSVSSVGAAASSSSFYLRIKGETEDGLAALGFDRLDILRPGLLIGQRPQQRPMEAVFQRLAPLTDRLMFGGLGKYRSIAAPTVAGALCLLLDRDDPGRFVHDTDALVALRR